ncbi:Ankyrin repeat domain-containing protein 63 [Liparis tanakae]|uniref:Ankyrin repeat domain-containing protein 63 n=1 Tax=Liparis tanakae TaxID=230148 RepID=A0A4Z2I2M1_9TELE|nr:Ankyrin repeat domain-containing protein 63 [Liparis tanakae]
MLKAQGKSDGRTGTKILLEAMSKDQVHLARFVLDALDGQIVDSRTEGAQTPLISSVLLPDSEARCKFAELLLQKGAGVNCRDGRGRTALSHACEAGHLDAVKILVRSNADPELADAWGNTALMYAAVAARSPVVEFLVRAFKRLGLQVDRRNKVGNSAVEVAKFLGHAQCVSALTHGSRKGREEEEEEGEGEEEDAQTRQGLARGVGPFVNALEDLTCPGAECLLAQSRQQRARGLPAMNSIEEFEGGEGGSSSSPPDALVFSQILTPKALARVPDHSQNHKPPKTGGEDLPPPKQSCEAPKSHFFSPRPRSNPPRPSARPSALDILLAPIVSNKRETEPDTGASKVLDYGVGRLHQKRCSLPTSMLGPAPRDRAPVRKSRTIRRRDASPSRDEPPTAATPTTTFSALSNKLLRRFTSPEFKTGARELEESPVMPSGRIPRSETFPRGMKHPQVDSNPSIDSISSVKCEFGIPK